MMPTFIPEIIDKHHFVMLNLLSLTRECARVVYYKLSYSLPCKFDDPEWKFLTFLPVSYLLIIVFCSLTVAWKKGQRSFY